MPSFEQWSAPLPWTVTIAGPERHDGEAPFTWVLQAPTRHQAERQAMAAHLANDEREPGFDPATPDQYGEPTYRLISIESGVPSRNCGYAFNDMRPGADDVGEHDCLAIETLRNRIMAWVVERSPRRDAGDDEAAQLVHEIATVLRWGLF